MAISQKLRALMSSDRGDWCTPDVVLDLVRKIGPIGLDPCANECRTIGARQEFFGPQDGGIDGTTATWKVKPGEVIYVNPPYGRGVIEVWLSACWYWGLKEYGNACENASLIALVPARTDTKWWHNSAVYADRICFWQGRLKFIGATAGAPFPSALLYWGNKPKKFSSVFSEHGWIVKGRV